MGDFLNRIIRLETEQSTIRSSAQQLTERLSKLEMAKVFLDLKFLKI